MGVNMVVPNPKKFNIGLKTMNCFFIGYAYIVVYIDLLYISLPMHVVWYKTPKVGPKYVIWDSFVIFLTLNFRFYIIFPFLF
jgi:hypothetical protein